MIPSDNKYTRMQKTYYSEQSMRWSPYSARDREAVVGSFDAHNNHPDYMLLLDGIDTSGMICLDFGCGPGRNMVRFKDYFKRIDGVDLVEGNLTNAKLWTQMHGVMDARLYLCNGVDLEGVPDEEYDFVLSTICLQHICVYDIRLNYLKEFFRVLRPGGWVAAQMGFGVKTAPDARKTVSYYDNHYDATTTNGYCDVCVDDPSLLEQDLIDISGFKNFSYHLRPPGPGDDHPQWIFFRAQKPLTAG